MIRIDAIALKHNAIQRQMEIREKELDFFSSNLRTISASSILLAGFSFAGLIEVQIPNDPPPNFWLELSYYLTQIASICASLIALVNSTACLMFGPGLALRGPTDGMEKAVMGLEEEQSITFRYMRLAVVLFAIAAGIWFAMATKKLVVIVVLNSCLIIFLLLFFLYDRRIQKLFSLRGSEGQFTLHDAIKMSGELVKTDEILRESTAASDEIKGSILQKPPVARNKLYAKSQDANSANTFENVARPISSKKNNCYGSRAPSKIREQNSLSPKSISIHGKKNTNELQLRTSHSGSEPPIPRGSLGPPRTPINFLGRFSDKVHF